MFHELKPFTSLSIYRQERKERQKVKFPCNVPGCGHNTSFFCIRCSNPKEKQFFAVCSPVNRGQRMCYHIHVVNADALNQSE